jgi:hypothetical protein
LRMRDEALARRVSVTRGQAIETQQMRLCHA